MSMSEQLKLVIRDGIAADIPKCVALDSTYQTEHVWQLNVREETNEIHISLRKQRLPRPLTTNHPLQARRLEIALTQKYCFIVLVESVSNTLLGYICMRTDTTHDVAYIQDIVIDEPYRRQGLGSRLINVAHLWANEKNLNHIIFEIPTTNNPCIEFAASHGFVYCGFNDQYLPDQEIALFYSLSL